MVAVIAFFSCYHNFTQGCKGLWYHQMLPVRSHCVLKTLVLVTSAFPCEPLLCSCMQAQRGSGQSGFPQTNYPCIGSNTLWGELVVILQPGPCIREKGCQGCAPLFSDASLHAKRVAYCRGLFLMLQSWFCLRKDTQVGC